MENNFGLIELELITVIVKCGLGSKVLKIGKKCGISGGTILLGKGTIKSWILEFLELSDVRKEIVLMVCKKETAACTLETLNSVLQLAKPNHGIAFSTGVSSFHGSKYATVIRSQVESKSEENLMYTQIYVIVDKGSAEKVMDAAIAAGSRGGTIINARGSGIHETSMLFSMEIEPEKEIVLILAENSIVDRVVSNISETQKINEPGNGIIFTQQVLKTYGMVQ